MLTAAHGCVYIKAEFERVRRELSAALSRESEAVEEAAMHREANLSLRAEVAGLRAAHETSTLAEATTR